MKIDRNTGFMLLVLLVFGVVSWVQVGAADVTDPRSAAAESQAQTVSRIEHADVATASARRLPMMQEIFAALEAKQIAVAELQARFDAATDETRALDLQREVETLKKAAELEILRIQLRYARDEGRQETVMHLETAIETMTTQRPRLEPREESRSRDSLRAPEVQGR